MTQQPRRAQELEYWRRSCIRLPGLVDVIGNCCVGVIVGRAGRVRSWREACHAILANIRDAMRPGARLFVVEMLIGEGGADPGAALMDMAMLFATTGQERDLTQFDTLLTAAGLRRTRTIPLRAPYCLIEADAC